MRVINYIIYRSKQSLVLFCCSLFFRHAAFSHVNCQGHPPAQSVKDQTCCVLWGSGKGNADCAKSLAYDSAVCIGPFGSTPTVLPVPEIRASILRHDCLCDWLTGSWCPRLNWAPRRKKKKGRGGHSWLLKENVSSENKELDLFAVFPPLHTVNVDEHSCIIFELLLSWKMRSKSIEDERVSVCVAELRKSFRGELCLFSEIQTVVVLLETAFKSSVLQCLSVILSFFFTTWVFFLYFS